MTRGEEEEETKRVCRGSSRMVAGLLNSGLGSTASYHPRRNVDDVPMTSNEKRKREEISTVENRKKMVSRKLCSRLADRADVCLSVTEKLNATDIEYYR